MAMMKITIEMNVKTDVNYISEPKKKLVLAN